MYPVLIIEFSGFIVPMQQSSTNSGILACRTGRKTVLNYSMKQMVKPNITEVKRLVQGCRATKAQALHSKILSPVFSLTISCAFHRDIIKVVGITAVL